MSHFFHLKQVNENLIINTRKCDPVSDETDKLIAYYRTKILDSESIEKITIHGLSSNMIFKREYFQIHSARSAVPDINTVVNEEHNSAETHSDQLSLDELAVENFSAKLEDLEDLKDLEDLEDLGQYADTVVKNTDDVNLGSAAKTDDRDVCLDFLLIGDDLFDRHLRVILQLIVPKQIIKGTENSYMICVPNHFEAFDMQNNKLNTTNIISLLNDNEKNKTIDIKNSSCLLIVGKSYNDEFKDPIKMLGLAQIKLKFSTHSKFF